MASDERKLVECLSFLADKAGRMVGEASKLIDYEGDVRSVPLDNLQDRIDNMRELLDEIEEDVEAMYDEGGDE